MGGYRSNGIDLEDLEQAGFIALMRAVDSFDPTAGVQFSTWYYPTVKDEFQRAAGRRTEKKRRDPLQSAVSLDVPVGEDEDGTTLGELVPDLAAEAAMLGVERREDLRRLHAALEAAIAILPPDLQTAVRGRYYCGGGRERECPQQGHAYAESAQMLPGTEGVSITPPLKPGKKRTKPEIYMISRRSGGWIMYGMNFSGGDNRTHGQIERAERIDSFEAGKVKDWGVLFTNSMVPLDCGHFLEDDREIVELSRGQWSLTLELTRTPSGFGGSCVFWLCPRCGKRVRFLYFKGRGFLCRNCAKLNYRCQQRTKDSANYARDGLKLAREKLRWEPPFSVVPAEFPYVTPDRPRYMHRTTYHRYLARYRRYQKRYEQDSMREMLAILRWGGVVQKGTHKKTEKSRKVAHKKESEQREIGHFGCHKKAAAVDQTLQF